MTAGIIMLFNKVCWFPSCYVCQTEQTSMTTYTGGGVKNSQNCWKKKGKTYNIYSLNSFKVLSLWHNTTVLSFLPFLKNFLYPSFVMKSKASCTKRSQKERDLAKMANMQSNNHIVSGLKLLSWQCSVCRCIVMVEDPVLGAPLFQTYHHHEWIKSVPHIFNVTSWGFCSERLKLCSK